MAQEKWLVDGPKTIDIESARSLKVGLIGGQIDIVAHDEPGVRVEVHSVSGKDLKISVDGDQVEIDHPQLSWDNWLDVFKSWSGRARADVSVMVPRDIRVKLGVVSATALLSGTTQQASLSTVSGDLVIDGAQQGDGTLALGVQLTDLHFTEAGGVVRSMDRLGENLEARLLVAIRPPDFAIAEPRVAERRRDRHTLDAPWRERPDVAAHLRGVSMLRGATAALLGRMGEAGPDRPLLDAALMLAPALIQVFAAVSDWAGTADRERWLLGMGGKVDSCWMWRRDGALQRLRTPEDPARF